MISTREAYGKALLKYAEEYNYVVCDADLAKATQTVHFGKEYPERFFDLGIAEANMLGYAAGLSTFDMPVFASTFAAFAAGRGYDQIRNTICYSNCNVKIAATHAGVLIGPDGGSHQCIEDIALMRVIPNMVVLCPADLNSTNACIKAALDHKGPVYLRFGRLATPEVYSEPIIFEIGKGRLIKEGTDITIIAIGDMVSKSLVAAEVLKNEGINAEVIDMASIKPIDKEMIIESAKKTGCVVTAEDHNVMGGLGSAVSEVLAKNLPVIVEMVGIEDEFGRSGEPTKLAEYYGIDEDSIVKAAKTAVSRKNN